MYKEINFCDYISDEKMCEIISHNIKNAKADGFNEIEYKFEIPEHIKDVLCSNGYKTTILSIKWDD